MTRTLLVGVGNEVALNTPTTLDNAPVVRVYNGVGSTATVSVAKSTTAAVDDDGAIRQPVSYDEPEL